MLIHHNNVKPGMIISEGNHKFYIMEKTIAIDGSSLVRGVYHEPSFHEHPTATQHYRLDEKVNLVGSYSLGDN